MLDQHLPMKSSLFALAFTLAAFLKTPAFAADAPKLLFEEQFSDRLGTGWQWLRERPEAWRITKGALIIDTLPGSYWQKQNSSKNTLLRLAPASLKDGFIIEVHLDNAPKQQYEHAGILCYFDGENTVAFNKEFVGKQVLFLVSEQGGKPAVSPEKEYRDREVWLRLILRGTKAIGQYRSSEQEPWQTVADRTIPTSTKELLVGVHSGYGLEKPERQARFRSFRILQANE